MEKLPNEDVVEVEKKKNSPEQPVEAEKKKNSPEQPVEAAEVEKTYSQLVKENNDRIESEKMKPESVMKPLTTANDLKIDDVLDRLFKEVAKKRSCPYDDEDEDEAADNMTETLENEAKKMAMESSFSSAHKLSSVLKVAVDFKASESLQKKYGRVKARKVAKDTMSENYIRCLLAWINSPFVSFAFGNPTMLGRIDIKDAFLLIFFSMVTTLRQRFDNLPQLIIAGISSSGY